MEQENKKITIKDRMSKLTNFLKSGLFIRNIVIMLVIAVLLVITLLLWMNVYTRHSNSITVPDFRTMTIDQVEKICFERNLRYQIVDSTYNTSVPKGTVLEQNPPALFKVKKERTIFLTIRAYGSEQTIMPKLINIAKSQAIADLETAGLTLGKITYQPSNFNDLVLDQKYKGRTILGGTQIEKGSQIELIIGKGDENDANSNYVPDLIGFDLYTARLMAGEQGLNIGSIIYDNDILSVQDTLSAKVYRQSPKCGSSTSPGSSVNIWMGKPDLTTKTSVDEEF